MIMKPACDLSRSRAGFEKPVEPVTDPRQQVALVEALVYTMALSRVYHHFDGRLT